MNYKLKKIFSNVRVLILIAFLAMAIVAINPHPFAKGVAIRSVLTNSSASLAGIQPPKPTSTPMSRERITAINNQPINTVEDYYDFVNNLQINQSIQIKTNKGLYRLTVRENTETIELNETIEKEIEETVTVNETINGTITEVNKTIEKIVEVPKTETISLGVEDIGLRVYEAPKSNIRKGLDLQGGTRVLLQPEEKLDKQDLEMLMENMKQRLNVYGLSDLTIRSAGDLSGKEYVVVEIAGANEEEIRDLLAKQGKFEAKIGDETVFVGGKDITYVCKSATCAGIDPNTGCNQIQGQWFCRFRFSITLSPQAAERQAELTKNLEVVKEDEQGEYLSEQLVLFLDDSEVDRLNIGADLKGRAVTDIQISGSGSGASQQEAIFDSLNNMKRLQTILITGSLPVKMDIVKIDAISPVLGEEFVKNAILLGLMALGSVLVVIFLRYRKLKVAIPLVIISTLELIILLGIAALIGWNLDLAAIAGIIIAIGTGVDHQIVITDETLKGETRMIFNWKERIKSAFFIIMGAYFTTVVAMIPLIFAGAGLLKGFAITTIIGVSIGVFISRPVYARLIEILLKE
jgi:preprotein translocase subunit SecD